MSAEQVVEKGKNAVDLSRCCASCVWYEPMALPIRMGKCRALLDMADDKKQNILTRALAFLSGNCVLEELERNCKWRPKP